MNLNITALKFELTPSLREHIEERVSEFEKFHKKITDVKVVMEIDDGHHKHGFVNRCEIIMRIPGQKDVFAESKSDDMHKAINQAAEEAERELKKIKGKQEKIDEAKIRELKGGLEENPEEE